LKRRTWINAGIEPLARPQAVHTGVGGTPVHLRSPPWPISAELDDPPALPHERRRI